MARTATLRGILKLARAAGQAPFTSLDTDTEAVPLALEGFSEECVGSVDVAAAAADQALTFTDALAIVLFADAPFSLRLAAGETLLANVRYFVVWADDTADEVHSTSVLLTGNGTSEVSVRYVILEKP